MLKISTIYVDTVDMKKLGRIAKKEGLTVSYLVRKAIKELIERKLREHDLKRITKKDGLRASYLVRKAVKEFIERKEQEHDQDWWHDFIEQSGPPVRPRKARSAP